MHTIQNILPGLLPGTRPAFPPDFQASTTLPKTPACLEPFQTHGDRVLEAMKQAAADFIHSMKAGNTSFLTLWGRPGAGNGTGKTFIAGLIRKGAPAGFCHFVSWPEYCAKRQARNDCPFVQMRMEDCRLLIIDDAGAENQTVWTVAELCRVMNYRQRVGKHTILTTNNSPDQWREIDSRISSRMVRDGARHVCCETIDYALRKFNKSKP